MCSVQDHDGHRIVRRRRINALTQNGHAARLIQITTTIVRTGHLNHKRKHRESDSRKISANLGHRTTNVISRTDHGHVKENTIIDHGTTTTNTHKILRRRQQRVNRIVTTHTLTRRRMRTAERFVRHLLKGHQLIVNSGTHHNVNVGILTNGRQYVTISLLKQHLINDVSTDANLKINRGSAQRTRRLTRTGGVTQVLNGGHLRIDNNGRDTHLLVKRHKRTQKRRMLSKGKHTTAILSRGIRTIRTHRINSLITINGNDNNATHHHRTHVLNKPSIQKLGIRVSISGTKNRVTALTISGLNDLVNANNVITAIMRRTSSRAILSNGTAKHRTLAMRISGLHVNGRHISKRTTLNDISREPRSLGKRACSFGHEGGYKTSKPSPRRTGDRYVPGEGSHWRPFHLATPPGSPSIPGKSSWPGEPRSKFPTTTLLRL